MKLIEANEDNKQCGWTLCPSFLTKVQMEIDLEISPSLEQIEDTLIAFKNITKEGKEKLTRKISVLELIEIFSEIDYEEFDCELRNMMKIMPELLGTLKKSLMLTHDFIEAIEYDTVLQGLRVGEGSE